MMKKIIAYNRVEEPVLSQLRQKYDVHFFEEIDTKSDPHFLEQLQTTEGIIGMGLPVDKTLLDRAPRLKIVSNVSVGYNNLDIEQLSKRGIMATHTPEVLNDTVADAIFGIFTRHCTTHSRIRS